MSAFDKPAWAILPALTEAESEFAGLDMTVDVCEEYSVHTVMGVGVYSFLRHVANVKLDGITNVRFYLDKVTKGYVFGLECGSVFMDLWEEKSLPEWAKPTRAIR